MKKEQNQISSDAIKVRIFDREISVEIEEIYRIERREEKKDRAHIRVVVISGCSNFTFVLYLANYRKG